MTTVTPSKTAPAKKAPAKKANGAPKPTVDFSSLTIEDAAAPVVSRRGREGKPNPFLEAMMDSAKEESRNVFRRQGDKPNGWRGKTKQVVIKNDEVKEAERLIRAAASKVGYNVGAAIQIQDGPRVGTKTVLFCAKDRTTRKDK